jgi:2-dehydropantoate 2-reductase
MKIAILGAGSIGCYLGGALIAAGADVILIGRARMAEAIAQHGLHLSDLHERSAHVAGNRVHYAQTPAALAEADLILVTVKSADTAQAGKDVAAYAKPSALVISFQNGIGNAEVLRAALPASIAVTVLGGMVPFNVVQMPNGRFHRGTEGELMLEASAAIAPCKAIFAAAGIPLVEQADFIGVQWGKLLLNLNNPINALSGLPLKTELSQRAYRRCLAALIDEALDALHAAQIEPAKIAKVGPHLLPTLLRLPDFLFTRIAKAMLRIDPEARSSMWEDLQAGRRTEVDYINGAVLELARKHGGDAPQNRRVVELIRMAEQQKGGTWSGTRLLAELDAVR